jgi:hypothetical protein
MKLVKEHINFERGQHPFDAMGIGKRAQIQKWLDQFPEYRSFDADSNKQIKSYCVINDDLTIDVYGWLKIPHLGLGNFPDYIQFKRVFGDFCLDGNKITSLRGSPNYIEGSFSCAYNHLTNLIGGPKIVEGTYTCSINDLISLEGMPEEIGGHFNCINHKIDGHIGRKFTKEEVEDTGCVIMKDIVV